MPATQFQTYESAAKAMFVGARDFHLRSGLAEFAKTELAVKGVGIAGARVKRRNPCKAGRAIRHSISSVESSEARGIRDSAFERLAGETSAPVRSGWMGVNRV